MATPAENPAPWWTATGLVGSEHTVIRWDNGFTCPKGPPEALEWFLMALAERGFGGGITPVFADWMAAVEAAARVVFPSHLIFDSNFSQAWNEPGTVY